MKIVNMTKKRINKKLWEQTIKKHGIDVDVVYIYNGLQKQRRFNKLKILKTTRGLHLSVNNHTNTIFLFDENEIGKSLDWLFMHEYRHLLVYNKLHLLENYLDVADSGYQKLIKPLKNKKNYLLYEPSEVDANVFATMMMGYDYGDEWYFKRNKKGDKNENH